MKLYCIKGIIIILIVAWLFSIGSFAIGDNSACADSRCHSDLVSQYTTTSHAVCIDCHSETSTYPHTGLQISEPDDCSSCHAAEVSIFSSSKHGYMKCSSCHDVHGASTFYNSLRKNIEFPLTDLNYSNTDFELCYMCHSVTSLMAMPDPDESSLVLLGPYYGFPFFEGPFATDFREMNNGWWDVDNSTASGQSNLHFDHIARLRGMGAFFWYPEGEDNGSHVSCVTCHNPHGSASPRLTVTNLSFEWDFSAGDNVGGNISGFDEDYCSNGCHYTNPYSRDNLTTNAEISVGGPDCIGCHGIGTSVERINENIIDIGIHANITGSTNPVDSNSRCWACHSSDGSEPPAGTHPDRGLNPYSCERCHSISAPPALSSPLRVVEHVPYGDEIRTGVGCEGCHNKSIENYGSIPNATITDLYEIAHYGKKRTDLYNSNESDCAYCHQNLTSEFSDIFVKAGRTNITHDGGNSCYVCHREEGSTDGRIHDSALLGSVYGACTTCHKVDGFSYVVNESDLGGHINLNSTGGDDTLTDGDCMTCHYANPHGGPDSTNTYYCADCHTSMVTSSPVKSIIQFTDGLHGENTCIDCHVADETYHQNDPRGSVVNLTYVNRDGKGSTIVADCADCHNASNLDDAPFNAPAGGSHILGNDGACTGSCHTDGQPTMIQTVHNVGVGPDWGDEIPFITVPVLNAAVVSQGMDVTVTATVTTVGQFHYVDGAQYRIMESATEIIPWTPMTAVDGDFEGATEDVTTTLNTSLLPLGTYTVEVRGMAGGPAKNSAARYYPMNGDVSSTESATLTVQQPPGYINGTVRSGGSVLSGVLVSTTGVTDTTGHDGTYSLKVPAGTYTVTAINLPEYSDSTESGIVVVAGGTIIQNFDLMIKLTRSISGDVKNKIG